MLPLLVYMVHGEFQHSLGDTFAGYLRKERIQARVRFGSRGQVDYVTCGGQDTHPNPGFLGGSSQQQGPATQGGACMGLSLVMTSVFEDLYPLLPLTLVPQQPESALGKCLLAEKVCQKSWPSLVGNGLFSL